MHTRELGLTREGVRDGFARAVGTYEELTKNDVYQLAHMVGVELCRRNRRIACGRAKGTQMEVGTVHVDCEDGRMVAAFILVVDPDGGDWEGVTFKADGSLGIAEWADERDAIPFLRALDAWVDEVRNELYWQRMRADVGGRDA